MKYNVWDAYPPDSGFASVEEMTGLTDEQESAVFFGKPLPQALPKIRIKKLSKGKMPDALGTFTSSRFVSAKLRKILEACCRDHIQFIPATLSRQNKPSYFLANITSHVASFDSNRSEFQSFEDPPHAIRAVKKMVLKPVPSDAPAIFHLEEIPAVILVRDDLRRDMEAISSSAGIFTDVDRFTFGFW